MYELALFAGAGGGILGGHLNGWRCVGAVECEGYPRGVLAARQNDGSLRPFPIWTDVRSFTKRNNATRRFIRWLRSIAGQLVISGGFPCQDISSAGSGAGITGERSGLWKEFARIIGEVRPAYVLVENSPVLTSRGLGVVLGDLAALGYDACWGVLGARDAGAPHQRDRIWIVAHAKGGRLGAKRHRAQASLEEAGHGRVAEGLYPPVSHTYGHGRDEVPERQPVPCCAAGSAVQFPKEGKAPCVSDALRDGLQDGLSGQCCRPGAEGEEIEASEGSGGPWWAAEPALGRVADGVAHRVDMLKALGNGQVSAVVRLAWQILGPGFEPFEERRAA